MNSERPRKPKSDFSSAFDNEEIEINVSYEEITPEEQLRIKQRANGVVVDSASEQVSDMWLDDEPEIVGGRQQINSDEIEPEEVLNRSDEVSEPEPILDDVAIKPNEQTEKIAHNLDDDLIESEPEPVLDDVARPIEPIDIGNDLIPEDELEPVLDDVVRPIEEEPALNNVVSSQDEIPTSEPIETENDSATVSLGSEENEPEINSANLEPIENEPALDNVDSSQNEITTSEPKETEHDSAAVSLDSEENEPEINDDNSQPELIADSWLDESENLVSVAKGDRTEVELRDRELTAQISQLEQQKTTLLQEIEELQAQKVAIAQQSQAIAENLGSMVEEGTRELKERKNSLLVDIEKLERRAERIRQEMRSNFAGASQDLAVRIQGFKQYLVGSLQDLTTAAERLDFPKPEERRPPRRESRPPQERVTRPTSRDVSSQPQFTEQAFADQTRRIRQLIEKYRTQPDYYGSPWQLRRTFEPIHAQKVQEWFFERGGRGAVKGMGSRLQNILVASAVISILYRLYRDRCRILVLVDTPEKLGEWRRGLQDCLGISRNDFGTNRGVVLFESADILVQRADRLLEDKLLPLIIIDETEELINLGLLKFPLWLAFAEKPQPKSSGYLY